MRVVLVAGRATGGIAVHVAALATGLADAGVDVAVATGDATADRWEELGSGAGPGDVHAPVPPGVPVLRLWPSPRRPLAALRRARALRRLLAGADVVHAHGHQAGLLALLAARGLRGPRRARGRARVAGPAVVVTWHNAVLAAPGGAAQRALEVAERLQARRVDLLTGASGDLVARARALGAGRVEVTPVGVPDRAADGGRGRGGPVPAPPPAGLEDLPPDALVVLTVSRLAPQKDLPTLVRAAARLGTGRGARGRGAPVTWCVVGDGDPAVEARVRRLVAQLDAPVRLLGARPDVPELLARADVFALSSTWEARSLAVQEAMAAGLPVVATRTGGLPDLLEGVGALVPVGDDRALADAVAALLADPLARERAGRAAREAFTALPGPQDVLRGWIDRYARLAADR
ncbi:glycosyltransferase family 4 protein [uncultured Pseudokineococcus sp.]|uniref:glycosyltransferase family 4 protein n=1 Tax=uncultured Pseudokineococcus sp. TaxID=1642928 RepID=UPI0026075EE2|nr:glycosyltransferase family 4 protein [uncultured Pseudokineococcus sp.]